MSVSSYRRYRDADIIQVVDIANVSLLCLYFLCSAAQLNSLSFSLQSLQSEWSSLISEHELLTLLGTRKRKSIKEVFAQLDDTRGVDLCKNVNLADAYYQPQLKR